MSWHVMVYSRGLVHEYSHPYAVHIFTSRKPSPDEAFRRAEEILLKSFPERGEDEREKEREYLAYVGYEELPLSLPPEAEGTYVASKFCVSVQIKEVQLVSTVPRSFAGALEEHRSKQFTLDFDEKGDFTKALLIDALNALRGKCSSVKVYETHRGYHLRSQLISPLPLEEILKVRRELRDDYCRIDIDKHYLRSGFGFLTNLLFHEKYWRDEPNGALQSTVETEINPEEITVKLDLFVPGLPKTSFTLLQGRVEVEGEKVIFEGRFGLKEAEAIVKSIKDNYWEYTLNRPQEADVKERVFKAYHRISPRLLLVLEKCEVSFSDGTVTIRVPEELSGHVGRLIGKQGQNVKAVEAELGVKVKIVQTSPPPEGVEMKARLKDLLRRVT
ncbi:MAG: KH domain-containing protein [Candidatus Nezhaarchaeales archaeon]